MNVSRIDDLYGVGNRKIVASHWRSEEKESEKLVCAFPGFGYSADGPATFYLKIFFLENGYDWIAFDYRYNENDAFLSLPDGEKEEYFAKEQAMIGEYILRNYSGKEIIFLGKSLGTSALALILNGMDFSGVRKKLILLTPTENCFSLAKAIDKEKTETLAVIGDRDPFYEKYGQSELYKSSYVLTGVIKGAGHIFEDGERGIRKSIANIYDVIEEVRGFLLSNRKTP